MTMTTMFTLSAFADEISPDPQEQIDILNHCGVKHIELRSIHKTNVLDLTDQQVKQFKDLLDRNGFRLSAIGSPIGKVKIDQPFEPHLKRFERAVELCKVFGTPNIRVFSYYKPDGTTWDQWRGEVISRMGEKARRAEKAGVRLLHENEHNIYGDDPARVVDLLTAVASPSLRGVRRRELRLLRLRPLAGVAGDQGVDEPLPHQGLEDGREATAAWQARGTAGFPR